MRDGGNDGVKDKVSDSVSDRVNDGVRDGVGDGMSDGASDGVMALTWVSMWLDRLSCPVVGLQLQLGPCPGPHQLLHQLKGSQDLATMRCAVAQPGCSA